MKRFGFNLLLFICLQSLTLILAITAPTFNISHFLYPKISDELRPRPSSFLEDVLNAISARQRWNSEDVRVSKLDVRNAKFGSSQRYEFRFRIGKSELIIKFRDEVSSWKKLRKGGDFESLVKEVSSVAVLDTFRVEGPFELLVDRGDELMLLLPLNISHAGLRRILVGEGIAIEVKSSREVSLFHASEFGVQMNRSGMANRESQFWPFWHSSCWPLLPVHISGSASVVAYRTRNPDAYIEAAFLSRDTIELLPEKCYTRRFYKKRGCLIHSLGLRIAMLENLLRSFLADRIRQDVVLGFLKAKMKASTVVRFQLELERDTKSNDNLQGTLAEWRTKSTVERVWFEVVARIEDGTLKPLVIKKVRHFHGVDSSAWSNLMSNISFTKFPSILVPQEALTLDVKW
uniref:Signal peptidase I n=1 Tax=Davidia involucrata TaxID=16924 RepID=A0A5B6ZU79_DAVIN